MEDPEIVAMIQRIQRIDYAERELPDHLESLKRATRCPHISDLIFHGDIADTATDILRKAREYRPFQL